MAPALQDDFRELLALFNAHGVEYLVVGGYAMAFHGRPRLTADLDLLIKPTRENAARILDALRDFGFGSLDLTVEDLIRPDHVVQLGVSPVRVDLLTSISGVSWQDAWEGRAQAEYGGTPVPLIGRRELIANKRAIGRLQDLADIEALGGQV